MPTNKLHLVLVFYFSSQDNTISKDNMEELEAELKKEGADVAAFAYFWCLCEISEMLVPSVGATTPVPGSHGAGVAGGKLFKGFSSLGNRVRPVISPLATCGCTVLIINLIFVLYLAYRQPYHPTLTQGYYRQEQVACPHCP